MVITVSLHWLVLVVTCPRKLPPVPWGPRNARLVLRGDRRSQSPSEKWLALSPLFTENKLSPRGGQGNSRESVQGHILRHTTGCARSCTGSQPSGTGSQPSSCRTCWADRVESVFRSQDRASVQPTSFYSQVERGNHGTPGATNPPCLPGYHAQGKLGIHTYIYINIYKYIHQLMSPLCTSCSLSVRRLSIYTHIRRVSCKRTK